MNQGLGREQRRAPEVENTHSLIAAKSLPCFHHFTFAVGFKSLFDDFRFSLTCSTSEMTEASLDGGEEGRMGVCGERKGRDDEHVTPIFEVKRNTSQLPDRRS